MKRQFGNGRGEFAMKPPRYEGQQARNRKSELKEKKVKTASELEHHTDKKERIVSRARTNNGSPREGKILTWAKGTGWARAGKKNTNRNVQKPGAGSSTRLKVCQMVHTLHNRKPPKEQEKLVPATKNRR